MSSTQDEAIFNSEADARAYLEAVRWPYGPFCPYCRETQNIGRLSEAATLTETLRCGFCGTSFTVATGSMMEQSRLPLYKWLVLLRQLNAGDDRATSAQIAQLFGLTATDPDLKISADGRILRANAVLNMVHHFNVPAGTTEIIILSRSVVPAELSLALKDFRRLGVCLKEIRAQNADFSHVWHNNDSSLSGGFYPSEEGHRWTNGRAVLPSLYEHDIAGPFTVEIHLADAKLLYALAAKI